MRYTDFGKVGQYSGSDGLQSMLIAEGYLNRQREMGAAHKSRVDNFVKLFAAVATGAEDPFLLREAFTPRHEFAVLELQRRYPGVVRLSETMATSDFAAYLTVDVLDRMLYGYWGVDQVPNMALVKRVPLRDFRTVKRFEIDGGVTPFEKQQTAGVPPAERALVPQTPITYAPDLYQGMMSVNWRAIINDDMGIFNDLIRRLADSWNLTIWRAITELYVDSSGPHASLYTSGFANKILTANGASVNNPPLSFQGLIDADTVLAKMLSPDDQPFTHSGKRYLVHGPALKTTAEALMKSLMADISIGGGTTNSDGFPSQRLRVATDYVTGGIVPVLDKYIPLVCTASGVKDTMWAIVYEPSAQPRPAMEFGMLRGFENPALFQKAPNTMRAGGGLDPSMGDFLTMDQDYKAIAVFGGTQVDGRSTVSSTGAGS
jgi:hypothetical protein